MKICGKSGGTGQTIKNSETTECIKSQQCCVALWLLFLILVDHNEVSLFLFFCCCEFVPILCFLDTTYAFLSNVKKPLSAIGQYVFCC